MSENEPSAAAMRAAKSVGAFIPQQLNRVASNTGDLWTDTELAAMIDAATGLPELLAALEDCERAIADDDGIIAVAARTRARAALAKATEPA